MIHDLADRLFDFEEGELIDEETLQLFADLVATGWAWHLQGRYGRQAEALLEAGYINEDGDVLVHLYGEDDDC
jgi:hypothetical protein